MVITCSLFSSSSESQRMGTSVMSGSVTLTNGVMLSRAVHYTQCSINRAVDAGLGRSRAWLLGRLRVLQGC